MDVACASWRTREIPKERLKSCWKIQELVIVNMKEVRQPAVHIQGLEMIAHRMELDKHHL